MATKLSGTYDKTEKCGCEVRWADDALVDGINFCPLHATAPALLAELEKVRQLLDHWATPGKGVLSGALRVVALGHAESAQEAIAQAREVPTKAQ